MLCHTPAWRYAIILALCTLCNAVTIHNAQAQAYRVVRLVVIIDLRAAVPEKMREWLLRATVVPTNLPPGSQIHIGGCGDTAAILEQETFVIPSDAFTQWIYQRYGHLIAMVTAKPEHRAGMSRCIAAAVQLLSPQPFTQNRLVVFSDGVESASRAAPLAPDYAVLPDCTIPPHTDVTLAGVGLGYGVDAAKRLQEIWRDFFTLAGVNRAYINVTIPYRD